MNLVQDYVLKFSDQAVHPIDVKHSFELYGRAESQQGKTVSRQHQRLKIDTSGLHDQHFARKQDIKIVYIASTGHRNVDNRAFCESEIILITNRSKALIILFEIW
jgi:hypothetical protein